MFKPYRLFLFFFLVKLSFLFAQEQKDFKIHSHNDYQQNIPFWDAYTNELKSIEVDIFFKNNLLSVAHDEKGIKKNNTLESLYLQPLQKAIALQIGELDELQILIDIKSEPYATLKELIRVLKKYPEVIYYKNISIVISGNRPKPEEYINYPEFIRFDYQSLEAPKNKTVWEKVALISLDFKDFSVWNGKGRMTANDYKNVKEVIDKAHAHDRPFRFWGAPDSKTAWKAFVDLEVGFINTDMPFMASSYLQTLESRTFHNTLTSTIYRPTYLNDQKNIPVKNIILLIGDGNGLSQISSSVLANGGELTLTQLKSIGFLKTQSADDFTTDSAAGGTAIATGSKTNNRAIGVDSLGKPLLNITEILAENGYVSGCITTDKITGATPAAFYAHQKDRSQVKEIATDLLKSNLSLFIGGGKMDFDKNLKTTNFTLLNTVNDIKGSKKDKVGVYLSEKGVPSILEGRGNILAEATKNGLEFLKAKKAPFFLMVESSQIDSFGHANNTKGIVSEGIDFDKAITEAIKFADASKNTLVIITADHETSGFSIPHGNLREKTIEGDFSTHDHTATMVPLFAYGPQSQNFQGVYENNDVFWKILKVLNIKK